MMPLAPSAKHRSSKISNPRCSDAKTGKDHLHLEFVVVRLSQHETGRVYVYRNILSANTCLHHTTHSHQICTPLVQFRGRNRHPRRRDDPSPGNAGSAPSAVSNLRRSKLQEVMGWHSNVSLYHLHFMGY